MMTWLFTQSNLKSIPEANRLVQDFFQHPLRNDEELSRFNADTENDRLNNYLDSCVMAYPDHDGWIETSVKIHVPFEKKHFSSEFEAPEFEVGSLHHHQIIRIIRDAFQDPIVRTFNLTPFTQHWKPWDDNDNEEQIYSEVYTSPAMLEAHEDIQQLPRTLCDDLERVVAPLMLWSDSTHLAQFGTASVWPFYLALGNQSKYVRGKPTMGAFHHLAYIPSVGSSLLDAIHLLTIVFSASSYLSRLVYCHFWCASLKSGINSLQT